VRQKKKYGSKLIFKPSIFWQVSRVFEVSNPVLSYHSGLVWHLYSYHSVWKTLATLTTDGELDDTQWNSHFKGVVKWDMICPIPPPRPYLYQLCVPVILLEEQLVGKCDSGFSPSEPDSLISCLKRWRQGKCATTTVQLNQHIFFKRRRRRSCHHTLEITKNHPGLKL
jgi:hypothetical protein